MGGVEVVREGGSSSVQKSPIEHGERIKAIEGSC